jgi:hypothetical protein
VAHVGVCRWLRGKHFEQLTHDIHEGRVTSLCGQGRAGIHRAGQGRHLEGRVCGLGAQKMQGVDARSAV